MRGYMRKVERDRLYERGRERGYMREVERGRERHVICEKLTEAVRERLHERGRGREAI